MWSSAYESASGEEDITDWEDMTPEEQQRFMEVGGYGA